MGEPWPPGGMAALAPVTLARAGVALRARTLDTGGGDGNDDAHTALMLYARMLSAGSLLAAAHGLVVTMAAEHGLGRVAIGLRERGRTRLLATSTADAAQGEIAERLTGAMDEAMDQGLALAWPLAAPPAPGSPSPDTPPPARDPAAAGTPAAAAPGPGPQPLVFELALLQRSVGGAVAVLPLGRDGRALGAVTLERPAGPAFDAATLARLSRVLVLAGPALQWMDAAERSWHRRALEQAREAAAALRRPEQRARRRLVLAGAATLAFLALAPLEQEVGGRARIEGAQQRVLAAPADGFVKAAHVRPGDRVRAGQALADLVEDDLMLERERWGSQLAQHQNAYAAAMGAGTDRVSAATALARVSEAQAQLALIDEQLGRGRLVAPFDGLVIEGDLGQAIGAPVRQGDRLLTLASLDRHRVIVEVDETDIAQIVPGQAGRLTLSALSWHGEDVVVERIVPMARAVDGRNVFEVEARLIDPDPALRPGQLGRAAIVVGRQPPLWSWLGRAGDRLRLAWWSWLG